MGVDLHGETIAVFRQVRFEMKRFTALTVIVWTLLAVLTGCSGGSDPVTPATVENPAVKGHQAATSQTHLWGYYIVNVDPTSGTIEIIPVRNGTFTANVVNFLNSSPSGLAVSINGIINGADFIDIDVDVSITHPFPGLPMYNGYDVRGVFMGDGSSELITNELIHPVLGTDQFMMTDPVDPGSEGGPDGYTRWFNLPEFMSGGMPMFLYTQGNLASPGFDGTSMLNPYKFFADGLSEGDDLWSWLNDNPDRRGQFSSGATNTRNYYIRFPDDKGITFGYAVTANWGGPEDDDHPSNADEAVGIFVADSSDLYFVDPGNSGGNLNLDISVWNWDAALLAGVMEEYKLFVESTVLSIRHEFSTLEMTPVDGDENFSTYSVEIPADDVQNIDGNEYWVIIEETDFDYSNEFGTPNDAWDDNLAAFFRFDVDVRGDILAWIEVTNPNGGEELTPGTSRSINWTSSGITGTVFLEYSDDDFVSDVQPIDSDIDFDAVGYMWEVPCDPSDTVKVRVSWTDNPAVNDMSDENFTITSSGWAVKYGGQYYDEGRRVAFDPDGNVYIAGTHRPPPGSRNYGFVAKFDPCGQMLWDQKWGGTGHTQGYGVAVDDDGNSYITGNFYGTTDFDPDDLGGPNQLTSFATWDAWLVKFDTDGDFVWVKIWGGGYSDTARGVAVDDSGDVYVAGHYSLTVDFDPEGGDVHTSHGDFDCFLTKFDSGGNHVWAKTWGSGGEDRGRDVSAGGGNVYMTGFFNGTGVNFNEDGSHILNSNGGPDAYLTAWGTDGDFQWAYNWGGTNTGISTDEGTGVFADDSGNVYCTGYIRGNNVNLDPTGGSDPHSTGANDSFVSVFDPDGNFEWAETWGGSSNDHGMGVAVDGAGDVYITGWFWGTADFDPDGGGQKTAVFIDSYLNKLDSSGDFQWVRTFGGTNVDRGFGAGCDPAGNIYATGFFQESNINFAPTGPPCNEPDYLLTPYGNADTYLVKFFPDGCW